MTSFRCGRRVSNLFLKPDNQICSGFAQIRILSYLPNPDIRLTIDSHCSCLTVYWSGRRFSDLVFLTPVEVEPRTRASGRDFPTDWANLSSTILGTAPHFPAARVHSQGSCRGKLLCFWCCCRGRVFFAFPANNRNFSLIFDLGLARGCPGKTLAEVLKQAAK